MKSLPRVLVIDTLDEYDLPVFNSLEELNAWVERTNVRPSTKFRVALRIPKSEVDTALLYAWALAPVIIVLEELDLYVGSEGTRGSPGIQAIVDYGRRFGIGIIGVARRAAKIPRDFTANSKGVVLFQTNEVRDRDYWAGFLPSAAVADFDRLRGHDRLEVNMFDDTWELHQVSGQSPTVGDAGKMETAPKGARE